MTVTVPSPAFSITTSLGNVEVHSVRLGVVPLFTAIQKISIYVSKQYEIYLIEFFIENTLQAIFILSNIAVFSKVMCSLLRTPNLRSTNRKNLKQEIQVVAITFVSGGVYCFCR